MTLLAQLIADLAHGARRLVIGFLLLVPSLGPSVADNLRLFSTELEAGRHCAVRYRRMAGYGDGHLPSQRDALVRQHNERGICLPEGRGSGRLSFVRVLSLLFGARRRSPFCDCPSPIGGVFGGSHHDEEIAAPRVHRCLM